MRYSISFFFSVIHSKYCAASFALLDCSSPRLLHTWRDSYFVVIKFSSQFFYFFILSSSTINLTKDSCENHSTDSKDLDDSEEEEEVDCNNKSTERTSIQEYDRNNKDKEADDNEEDDLKFLLELEDNWGELQSLFNPVIEELLYIAICSDFWLEEFFVMPIVCQLYFSTPNTKNDKSISLALFPRFTQVHSNGTIIIP